MDNIRIEAFSDDMGKEVVGVLARAFITNPINAASLGSGELEKNVTFFSHAVPVMRGERFVAMEGDRIVGFIHWVDSPACQLSGSEKIGAMIRLVGRFGFRTAFRIAAWLSAWSKEDPAEPHCHLGPIGVDPEVQGHGIGTRLMERYCQALDSQGKDGYLETDRPENVSFYGRFGFETVKETEVLGVANYYMLRKFTSNRTVNPLTPEPQR